MQDMINLLLEDVKTFGAWAKRTKAISDKI